VTGRRGGKRQQLLNDLQEMKGYWKSKESALDRTVKNWLWKRLWTCRKADYVMYEPLGVHSTTYFYVLLVKTLYRPQCICFLRSSAKRAPIMADSSKRLATVPDTRRACCMQHEVNCCYVTYKLQIGRAHV
jgi:hypothetical protein